MQKVAAIIRGGGVIVCQSQHVFLTFCSTLPNQHFPLNKFPCSTKPTPASKIYSNLLQWAFSHTSI